MRVRRFARFRPLVAVIAGLALVLVGCTPSAPEPEETQTPSPSPSASAVAYDGPAVFVGDELDAFLLSADEISGLLPDVSEVSAPVDGTEMYADGGGEQIEPEECAILRFEQQLRSVGARTVSWRIGDTDELGPGTLHVLSFGSVEQAEDRMDQLLVAGENCASFQSDGDSTFTGVATDERDEVRAIAGTLHVESPWYRWQAFYAWAQVGNVLVQVVHEFSGDTEFASERAVAVLADRAEEAHAALIKALTEQPPTEAEPPQTGSEVPVAEWPVVFNAVGPIALGADARAVEDALPSGVTTEWDAQNDELEMMLPDAAGSLRVHVDGQGVVRQIDVGGAYAGGPEVHDGAKLPSAEGVRLGDPLSDVREAFPEGSVMRLIAASTDRFMVADREGHVIMFDAYIHEGEAGTAPIRAIMVEDASLWTPARH